MQELRGPQTTVSETPCQRARHAEQRVSLTRVQTGVSLQAMSDVFATVRTMGNKIGYARVSTTEQDPALQHDALTRDGCYTVYTDVASGSQADRPQLAAALTDLGPGDVLVVWKLDRLGRSLRDLIDTVTALEQRGVGFRSVQESIDTTTPGGRLVFHVFAALAEFEQDLIRERTLAGLEAAKSRGRRGGRPSSMTSAKLRQAQRMHADNRAISEIAAVLGVSRATVYRHLTRP